MVVNLLDGDWNCLLTSDTWELFIRSVFAFLFIFFLSSSSACWIYLIQKYYIHFKVVLVFVRYLFHIHECRCGNYRFHVVHPLIDPSHQLIGRFHHDRHMFDPINRFPVHVEHLLGCCTKLNHLKREEIWDKMKIMFQLHVFLFHCIMFHVNLFV